MFWPELQKLLKSIYDLTRKGRPFLWGKEQQDVFEEIKNRMQKPQVLRCPIEKTDLYCILHQQDCNRQHIISISRWKTQAYCLCEQKDA